MSRLNAIRTCLIEAAGLHDGVEFYLFGSVLQGAAESDIDLLCVYDSTHVAPENAYSMLKPLFKDLLSRFGSPVHPVVLTEAEEKQVRFIESENCLSVRSLSTK